jgi:hypothetical protein
LHLFHHPKKALHTGYGAAGKTPAKCEGDGAGVTESPLVDEAAHEKTHKDTNLSR